MKTTRAIVGELITNLVAQFETELKPLPMTKKTREDLTAGFRDGVRSGVLNTLAMLEVTIEED